MTHSLHRRGTVESLKDDYVLIARTSRVNKATTAPALSRVVQILLEAGVSNIGSSVLRTNLSLGLDLEQFMDQIPEAHGVLCSFSSKEKLRKALAQLAEVDLGISITVSGLIDEVIPLAQELGLTPHTVNLSMGTLGRGEMLPPEEVLEITTMCGHALISANLVKKGMEDVGCGRKSALEASLDVGKPCVCGIFNLDRGERLLRQRAGTEGPSPPE